MQKRLELNNSTSPTRSISSSISPEVHIEETLTTENIDIQANLLEKGTSKKEDNSLDTPNPFKKKREISEIDCSELIDNTNNNSFDKQIKKSRYFDESTKELSPSENGNKLIDNDDSCNNNNSRIINSADKKRDYFYKKGGATGLSFIVLDQYGVMIGAGRKPYPTKGPTNNRFLLPQNPPYKGTYPYRTAYMAFDSEIKSEEGEEKPVQIFFMRGLKVDGESCHFDVGNAAKRFEEILKEKKIKLDSKRAKYSGECESDLTEEEVESSMLGYRLTRIRFNLRGTKTNDYRNGKKGHQNDADIPSLVTYLPEELIDFHPIHDSLIKSKIQTAKLLKSPDSEKNNLSVGTSSPGFFATNKASDMRSKPSGNYEINEKDDQIDDNNNNNTDDNVRTPSN